MTHNEQVMFQVWKEAFNEDDDYIEFFLKEGLPLGCTLAPEPPSAQLTLFPISFLQEGAASCQGYYLYGLGALRSVRGKGWGKILVKRASAHAADMGKQFILLQYANDSLRAYYNNLDYNASIYRSSVQCTRHTLNTSSEERDYLCYLLSAIAAPTYHNGPSTTATAPHFDRFLWSPQLLEYIRKECLFRKGDVIDNAYCYPNIDKEGDFLEIKEFTASLQQIPALIDNILTRFPHIHRFRFYGKPYPAATPEYGQKSFFQLRQDPFALLHFIDPDLEKRYRPQRSYFALGLD